MYRDVNIVAMRGRNPKNPKSRKSGIPTEQMLELNPNGTSNALTTVQKDKIVLFQKPLKVGNVSSEHSEGGCVYSDEGVSQTITAGTHGYGMGNILTEYRIRKLTPKECYRLMGVDDKDADKMIAVNSNTQCYKQAGNSIVVDVMAAMFERLF